MGNVSYLNENFVVF